MPLRVCVKQPLHPGCVAFGQFVVWYRSVVNLRGGRCAGDGLAQGKESLVKGKESLAKGKGSLAARSEEGSFESQDGSLWNGRVDTMVDELIQRRYLGYIERMLVS